MEKELDEELARFLKEGPTAEELERVKAQYEANFIRGIERIGGFGGKSDRLAMSQVFRGSPDAYKVSLKRVREATRGGFEGGGHSLAFGWRLHSGSRSVPDYKTAEHRRGPEQGADAGHASGTENAEAAADDAIEWIEDCAGRTA